MIPGMGETSIFHMTEPALWDSALTVGAYTGSTRGADLDEVGFIHCSFEHQVKMVANFVYGDFNGPLVLLEIDPDQVPDEIRAEGVDGGTEEFPHIYGPLPVAAVTAVRPLVRQPAGWVMADDR
jgi:uncharacterized protein (DUF952 family)